MKIKHTITANKVEVIVFLTPKVYKEQKTVSFDIDKIISFCRSRNLPIGSLISGPPRCTNEIVSECVGTWLFTIDKQYKKKLTTTEKPVTINSNKKSTARSRARNIAKKRKSTRDANREPNTSNK